MDNETLSRFSRADRRNGISSWLSQSDFTHFVTFNFNGPASLESGRRALKKFHARTDRELFGPRFNRRDTGDRTFFIAFPEHLASNLHFHALLRSPDNRFERIASRIWLGLIPSGQLHIEPVESQGDKGAIARYITKECGAVANYDAFIISTEFSSR